MENETRTGRIKRYVDERNPNFKYIGNCPGEDGYVYLKCNDCGGVITRSTDKVRRGAVKCGMCIGENERRIAAQRAQKKKQADLEKLQSERNRLTKEVTNAAPIQLQFKACEMCGALFIVYGQKKKFCSAECGARCNDAIKKDRRIRKMRAVVDDKSITLERLYKKAKGVCALCGGLCDYKDYIIRDDGTFIAGGNYPSIDHIVPLSKGGRHAWNNVQLACRNCNSRKSDSIAPSV